MQALLRRSAQKFREDAKMKQLRFLNNPEDAAKGILGVNTEDTSSGSAAQNKVTAATTEQSENTKEGA